MSPEPRVRRRAAIIVWILAISLATALAIFVFHRKSAAILENSLMPDVSNHATITCDSDQCTNEAGKIGSSIDTNYEPCNKFYSFACGKFSGSIDSDQRAFSRQMQLQDEVNEKLHALLNSSIQVEENVKQMMYIRQLYKKCVNPEGNSSIWSVREIIRQVTSLNNPVDKIAKMISIGESAVIDMKVKADPFNTSHQIIWLDQPQFAVSRIELLSRKANENSLSHIQSFINFASFAFNFIYRDRLNRRESMSRAVDFEFELAKKSTKPLLHQDHKSILRRMTLAQLNSETNSTSTKLDFIRLMNRVAQYSNSSLRLSPSDYVIVGDIEYLKNLGKILSEYSTLDELAYSLDTYLQMRIIISYTFLVKSELNALENHLTGNFSHIESFKLRDRCLNLLRHETPELMDRYYAHIHPVTGEEIEAITRIKNTIVKAYIDAIANDPELSWADSEKLALKALSVAFNFAYPAWIFNSTTLSHTSPRLDFDGSIKSDDSSVRLAFEMKKRVFSSSLQRLRVPRSQLLPRWPISASSISTAYDAMANSVTIPAAVMQPYYFHINFTESLNYAGLGILMAHGLIHAFTPQGIHYDKYGNLNKWLSDESLETFLVRSECVEHMYSYRYADMDIKLEGDRIIEESTADLTSIKLAYRAYQGIKEQQTKFTNTSLHAYTNEQIFFIHFASIRCHLVSKSSLRYQVLNSPSAPMMIRILYSLINSEDFASSFTCHNSTRMVPESRCKVL